MGTGSTQMTGAPPWEARELRRTAAQFEAAVERDLMEHGFESEVANRIVRQLVDAAVHRTMAAISDVVESERAVPLIV